MTSLATLSALEAALGIAAGEFSSQDLVSACVERIAEMDEQIGAWTYFDVDYALAQAKAADEHRQSGLPTGSLLGLPVAVKDIFDTADMPLVFSDQKWCNRILNTHDKVEEFF